MADTPYPLPKSIRQTEWLVGDGSLRYGPFGEGWGIFDEGDVLVETRLVGSVDFAPVACVIEKASSARYASFYVNFPTALASTHEFRATGLREHERDLAVTRGGAIDGVMLELELSKQAAVLQEQRRDIDQSLKVLPGQAPLTIDAAAIAAAESYALLAQAGATRVELGPLESESVVALGLVADNNSVAVRNSNRAYLQGLIDAYPDRAITILRHGTGTYHLNGSLHWPELYPPQLRIVASDITLHWWSVDSFTVTYWKDAAGVSITEAEGLADGTAVQQVLYFNLAGKQITANEAAILGGGNYTTAMSAVIKANIFWMGAPESRGPRIQGGKHVCRYDGDTEKASCIYLERTRSTDFLDAPIIGDFAIGRNGTWTPGAFTLKAFHVGVTLRGFALNETSNISFSGIEPWQALDGNLSTARKSLAAVHMGDSWNGLACINAIVQGSSLYSAEHGVLVEGEFTEGGKLLDCNVQEINYGLLVDNLAGVSQVYFTVSDTHINANVANVLGRGLRMLVVNGNYFAIKRTTSEANTYAVKLEGFSGTAVYDAIGLVVVNNVFNSLLVEGYSYGVHLTNCKGGIVAGNQFISSNKPLHFDAGCENVHEANNTAYMYRGETVASKLAYVGSDYITDLGENPLLKTVTADAPTNVTIAANGTVVDEAALTAVRSRSIFSAGMRPGSIVTVECRTTGGQNSQIRDGLTAAFLLNLTAGQFVRLRWTAAGFVAAGKGNLT